MKALAGGDVVWLPRSRLRRTADSSSCARRSRSRRARSAAASSRSSARSRSRACSRSRSSRSCSPTACCATGARAARACSSSRSPPANPITMQGARDRPPGGAARAPRSTIGAVIAGARERTLLAAVLLGLAIATKAWAVLAIGPVLLALPRPEAARARPSPGTVCAAARRAAHARGQRRRRRARRPHDRRDLQPVAVWWPLGERDEHRHRRRLPRRRAGRAAEVCRRSRTRSSRSLDRPALAAVLAARPARQARAAASRCSRCSRCCCSCAACSTRGTPSYYELPFLLALLAWEALCRPSRPPVLTLARDARDVDLTFEYAAARQHPDLLYAALHGVVAAAGRVAGTRALRPWSAAAVASPRRADRLQLTATLARRARGSIASCA